MEKETKTGLEIGKKMERLVKVMAALRSEGGCPWDREQTTASLKPYLLEEAYEVLEAIDEEDPEKLQEELGDVLLQVVFHAQIAQERNEFTIDGVIDSIADKLIRRHPHVFADVQVAGVAGVLSNWEKIKQKEKAGERESALDGVPRELPALLRAEKIQSKAARVGFDWEDMAGPLAKAKEEFQEMDEVLAGGIPEKGTPEWQKLEEEFGDILFALVNVGRFLHLSPELALRKTIDKFYRRFRYIETESEKAGQNLREMALAEMDKLWEEAKHKVKNK